MRRRIGARQNAQHLRDELYPVDLHDGVTRDRPTKMPSGHIRAQQQALPARQRIEQRVPLRCAAVRERPPPLAENEDRGLCLRVRLDRQRLRALHGFERGLRAVAIQALLACRIRTRRRRARARRLDPLRVGEQRKRIKHRPVGIDPGRARERPRRFDADAHGLLLRGGQGELAGGFILLPLGVLLVVLILFVRPVVRLRTRGRALAPPRCVALPILAALAAFIAAVSRRGRLRGGRLGL